MSVNSLNTRKNHIKDLMPDKNKGIKIIPQILSNNPNDFIALCTILKDYDYNEINWNLGCPYPMVANKIRGSGLLPFPQKIEEFLDAVLSKIDISLSVKIRLGRFNHNEVFNLIPVFNKFSLTKVIIHPRIGIQMYDGNVNLDIFEECTKLLKHSIVYNGDIKDINSFKILANRFSFIEEWMIGRHAVSNPFLADSIKNNFCEPSQKIVIIKAFYDELFARYEEVLFGPKHLMDKMKEIWSYLSVSFKNGENLYKKIIITKNINEFKTIVSSIFSNEEWIA